MECDGLGLDLALLDVDLVTAENDRDVLADSDQVAYRLLASSHANTEGLVEGTHGASWERFCR